MRGTLASNTFPITVGAFLLLGAWCAASFAATSHGADQAGMSRVIEFVQATADRRVSRA